MKAGINRHFLRLLASFLGMILITIGGAENGHQFFGRRIIKKNSAPKCYDKMTKYLSPKQISVSFDEI